MSILVRTCSTDRLNVSRLIARILIVVGGLTWAMMFFAQASTQKYADLTYSFREVINAGVSAFIPLVLTVGVFILCMYYEKLAAIVLFLGAGAVAVFGVISGWALLIWVSVLATLALPMVVAGTMLLLAASTQRVCELEGKI